MPPAFQRTAREATEAPPCPHFPDCAGCALIGQAYGDQLRLKRQRVQEAFGRFPALGAIDVPAVIGSPRPFGYRNQAKLVARSSRRGLLLGVYRPQSHDVVDISACPVHHPLIARVLQRVRAVIERYQVPIYDERTHNGTLRYVIVRVSTWTKGAQIVLVTRTRRLDHSADLVRGLRMRGVVSIVQNINPEPGNVIFGREFVPLTRETTLVERVGFLKLKTQAGSFLQANIAVARKLYERALLWVAPTADEVCVDLYCGVGALTFHLATAAKLAVGIEESPYAVADAKQNIRLNGFHNVRFHCGTVHEMLPRVLETLPRVDVITLNPTRKGADAATRSAVVAAAPSRIVYVSCEPQTLARDLDWFATHAYQTMSVQPYDLLPQTEHVECVVLLRRTDSEVRR